MLSATPVQSLFLSPLALFLVILFCLSTVTSAKANTTNNKRTLPMNVILDNQGNPIRFPPQTQPALDYSSKEAAIETPPKRIKSRQSKSKQSSVHKKSSKPSKKHLAQIATADHPRCRWLNQRLKQLRKSERQAGNSKYGYHAQERTQRLKEWDCLNCKGQGPSIKDLRHCHIYR
ncbi:hypothetical protein [Shewanella gelidii]|uniref:hypothetical protein n=1 Tax=Shewanella gelidii TaxID=1642821 RepID=UPI00166D5FCF|nr:hypothetical protein [Shewanella gelidii]MCL1099137.1 hypothetical protein [Shewanella gelidii]